MMIVKSLLRKAAVGTIVAASTIKKNEDNDSSVSKKKFLCQFGYGVFCCPL